MLRVFDLLRIAHSAARSAAQKGAPPPFIPRSLLKKAGENFTEKEGIRLEAPQRTGAAPEPLSWEPLSRGAAVCVSRVHRFSTDTILLADFSLPKRGETCAEFCAGCGALSLLWAVRAAPARVFAVELQQDAADLCRSSIARNGLAETVSALCADLRDRDALRTAFEPGSLDRIACNPPYQPAGTGVKSQIPGERLARHEETCTFADAAASAAWFLRWGGKFCFCHRPDRLPAVFADLARAGLEPKRLRLVQHRPGREPFLALVEAVRGGKPGLRVLPVLIVESETGGWSPEMAAVYGDYPEGRLQKQALQRKGGRTT